MKLHHNLIFIGSGIIIGLTLQRATNIWFALMKPKKPRKSLVPKRERRGSIMQSEAYQSLEAAGKIDWKLSPSDNAIKILRSILQEDLDDTLKSSIVYVLDVLKSDSSQTTVPVGLQMDNEKIRRVSGIGGRRTSLENEDVSDAVVGWLLANYTPDKNLLEKRKKKLTLKSVARSVKIALKLNKAFDRIHSMQQLDIIAVEQSQWEAIQEVLIGVDDWDWDIWKLNEASSERPLQFLGWHLLNKWDLIRNLKLDRTVVQHFLIFVENEYNHNDYHSSVHAADVLQAVHHLLEKCGASQHMTPLIIFSLLITAMIHDIGHDGLSNLYHQNAGTSRALLFNDQSVQENYHCMTVFTRMSKDSSINILSSLDPAQAKEVRRLVILMTLGTDMKNHFKHFQEFKGLVSSLEQSDDLTSWADDSAALDQVCANLLHAADLSNPCRPFGLARRWAEHVLEEFFAQGDRERAEGLPVSPLCGRDGTLIAASQIGFINFVVLPYYQVKCLRFPPSHSIQRLVRRGLLYYLRQHRLALHLASGCFSLVDLFVGIVTGCNLFS